MISFEEIQNYCKGKRVLIVGNSGALLKSKKGDIIDSYDIVVRMGHGFPQERYYDHVGKRTDIWVCAYKNIDRMRDDKNKFNPKYIIRNCFPVVPQGAEKITYFTKDNQEQINEIRNILHNSTRETVRRNPTTGFVSIFLFLNYIKTQSQLDIVGFDFFQTPLNFYEQGRTDKVAPHKCHRPDLEKLVIEKLIKNKTIGLI